MEGIQMPLVSVIMNCYNGEAYLSEALDSVFNQTFKDYEIVFWDNQSNDNSAKIALSYGDKVCYFLGESFLSLGEARNEAVSRARGKYITFLDCDDVWLPSKLEEQVQLMEGKPDIGFLYSNYYQLNTNANKKQIMLKNSQPVGFVFKEFFIDYPVAILTVMIRKSDWDHLEIVFDKNLNLAEEYDAFLRFLLNVKAGYISNPIATYRVHSEMNSNKFYSKWPEELEYIINKFINNNPEFQNKYRTLLNYKIAEIEYIRAREMLIQGKLEEARPYLCKCKFVRTKYFVAYLCTFLPKEVWLWLKPYWSNKGVFIIDE